MSVTAPSNLQTCDFKPLAEKIVYNNTFITKSEAIFNLAVKCAVDLLNPKSPEKTSSKQHLWCVVRCSSNSTKVLLKDQDGSEQEFTLTSENFAIVDKFLLDLKAASNALATSTPTGVVPPPSPPSLTVPKALQDAETQADGDEWEDMEEETPTTATPIQPLIAPLSPDVIRNLLAANPLLRAYDAPVEAAMLSGVPPRPPTLTKSVSVPQSTTPPYTNIGMFAGAAAVGGLAGRRSTLKTRTAKLPPKFTPNSKPFWASARRIQTTATPRLLSACRKIVTQVVRKVPR